MYFWVKMKSSMTGITARTIPAVVYLKFVLKVLFKYTKATDNGYLLGLESTIKGQMKLSQRQVVDDQCSLNGYHHGDQY